jgi:hypothetical protein
LAAGRPTDGLAAAAWAFAHGNATLRLSGSLARHFPDRSPGVAALFVEVLAG